MDKNSKSKVLFDGAFVLALATVVTKVLGLLYKAPLSRILGDEGMGYFNSAYTVYTFFYILCSAGVPKAITIIISENDAKNERVGEKRILTVAFLSFFIIGLAFSLIFFTLSEELCVLIKNSGAFYTMLSVAPSVMFVSLAGVAKGFLNGHSRLVPIAVSQLIEGGAKFFLGIAFAKIGFARGMSLPLLSAFTVLGITLGTIFSALYLVISTKSVLPKKKCRTKIKSYNIIKRIIKISVPLTLGAAVMSISNIIDLLTIMSRLRALGYSEAGASALYGNYTTLAIPMFNLVTALVSPFFIAALPLISRSFARGDFKDFEDKTALALRKALFISVPATVVFIFYSKESLSLIFEKSAVEVGAPLLSILAPSLIFFTAQCVINTALEGAGHYKAPIITMLVGAAVKLVASFFLISNGGFGIAGAPFGTVLSYAFGFFTALLFLYTSTTVTVPIFREIFRPLLCALGAFSIAELLKNLLNFTAQNAFQSLILLVIFAFFYCSFYAIIFLYLKNNQIFPSNCTKKELNY